MRKTKGRKKLAIPLESLGLSQNHFIHYFSAPYIDDLGHLFSNIWYNNCPISLTETILHEVFWSDWDKNKNVLIYPPRKVPVVSKAQISFNYIQQSKPSQCIISVIKKDQNLFPGSPKYQPMLNIIMWTWHTEFSAAERVSTADGMAAISSETFINYNSKTYFPFLDTVSSPFKFALGFQENTQNKILFYSI